MVISYYLKEVLWNISTINWLHSRSNVIAVGLATRFRYHHTLFINLNRCHINLKRINTIYAKASLIFIIIICWCDSCFFILLYIYFSDLSYCNSSKVLPQLTPSLGEIKQLVWTWAFERKSLIWSSKRREFILRICRLKKLVSATINCSSFFLLECNVFCCLLSVIRASGNRRKQSKKRGRTFREFSRLLFSWWILLRQTLV